MNPKNFPFLLNNLEKEAEMNTDSLSVTYKSYMYIHIHMHLCVYHITQWPFKKRYILLFPLQRQNN